MEVGLNRNILQAFILHSFTNILLGYFSSSINQLLLLKNTYFWNSLELIIAPSDAPAHTISPCILFLFTALTTAFPPLWIKVSHAKMGIHFLHQMLSTDVQPFKISIFEQRGRRRSHYYPPPLSRMEKISYKPRIST